MLINKAKQIIHFPKSNLLRKANKHYHVNKGHLKFVVVY